MPVTRAGGATAIPAVRRSVDTARMFSVTPLEALVWHGQCTFAGRGWIACAVRHHYCNTGTATDGGLLQDQEPGTIRIAGNCQVVAGSHTRCNVDQSRREAVLTATRSCPDAAIVHRSVRKLSRRYTEQDLQQLLSELDPGEWQLQDGRGWRNCVSRPFAITGVQPLYATICRPRSSCDRSDDWARMRHALTRTEPAQTILRFVRRKAALTTSRPFDDVPTSSNPDDFHVSRQCRAVVFQHGDLKICGYRQSLKHCIDAGRTRPGLMCASARRELDGRGDAWRLWRDGGVTAMS